MLYDFKTTEFGITGEQFHLLRSRFVHKKFGFDEVRKIRVKKGVTTKYPVRLIIFGCVLILAGILWLYFAVNSYTNNTMSKLLYFRAARGVLAHLACAGLLIFMGMLSLSHVLFWKETLILELEDGSKEVFSLHSIVKEGHFMNLINYLIFRCPNHQLSIQSVLIKDA